MKSVVTGIVILFGLCLFIKADDLDSATVDRYLSDIENHYNKLIFPKYESYGQLRIQISFQLISINGFDEVSGILELVGKLKITWKDENIKELYIPSSYADISQILVPQNEVWLPTITVYNSVDTLKMVGDSSYHVTILPPSGYLNWVPGVITRTGCTVDATFFPFDKQTCEITFVAWGYKDSEVYMYSRDDMVDLGIYNRNDQWEIDDSSVYNSSKGGQNFFTYKITLARQPMWFLINMILPIVVISILTSLVFLMPVDCGERIGYIITAFLTFAFFLDMVSSKLPQTSNPMAFICYFLTVMLYLSSISTIFIIISMRIYDKDPEEKVPMWLKVIVAIVMLRFCCRKKKEPEKETPEENEDEDKESEDEEEETKLTISVPPASHKFRSFTPIISDASMSTLKNVTEKDEKNKNGKQNPPKKGKDNSNVIEMKEIPKTRQNHESSKKETDDQNSVRKRGKGTIGGTSDKEMLVDIEETKDKGSNDDDTSTENDDDDKGKEEKGKDPEEQTEYYGPTEDISYRLVGLAMDILFFLVFLLVNMVCSIVFLMPLATGKQVV